MIEKAKTIAKKIYLERYSDSDAFFLAGSILRGEETNFSDLDIVILYSNLENAYRDSLIYEGVPVEVFVHDEGTLKFFVEKKDSPSGFPYLADMISEGIEMSGDLEAAQKYKNYAKKVLDSGPEAWDQRVIDRERYSITNLVDDLREPRSFEEACATVGLLYEALANFYFRTNQKWSARGKSIPRRLKKIDIELSNAFADAFNKLYREGQVDGVLELSERILTTHGGFLFDGYKMDAPKDWRK